MGVILVSVRYGMFRAGFSTDILIEWDYTCDVVDITVNS